MNPGSKIPFSTELRPFVEDNEFIKELKGNKDKLVREEKVINGSVHESIAYYSQMKQQFKHMQSHYGINMPDTDIVIGENAKGDPTVFLVVDKIDGESLKRIKNLPESAKYKLERFYLGILNSMYDAYRKGEAFFNDINLGNFMYGHKSKENNVGDDFFLSDIGPAASESLGGFKKPGEHRIFTYDQAFVNNVRSIQKDTGELAKKFDEPPAFTQLNQRLREISGYIQANVKEETLEEFLARLENGES